MIPAIIRLRGDVNELQERVDSLKAICDVQQGMIELLIARGDLMNAHVENLIERMSDLETWLARTNPGYARHLNSDCTCGWGGQHDPDNPRCLRNQERLPTTPPE